MGINAGNTKQAWLSMVKNRLATALQATMRPPPYRLSQLSRLKDDES